MKIESYSYAFDPTSKRSVLLYLGGSELQNCNFIFDVQAPAIYDEFPAPVRDFGKLATALGRSSGPPGERQNLVVWVAMELLRRYVNKSSIPTDGESGIERHWREMESQVA